VVQTDNQGVRIQLNWEVLEKKKDDLRNWKGLNYLRRREERMKEKMKRRVEKTMVMKKGK
jgi:hypothetical protein